MYWSLLLTIENKKINNVPPQYEDRHAVLRAKNLLGEKIISN